MYLRNTFAMSQKIEVEYTKQIILKERRNSLSWFSERVENQ